MHSIFQNLILRATVQLSRKERLIFTKYLAVLLGSGLTVDESVKTLHAQSKGSLKKILATLLDSLSRGDTLADGLKMYTHVFSPIYLNLVAAGEASGTLQTNIENLVDQMEKEYKLIRNVRGAMVYPMVIIVAAIGISTGIVIFILPNVTNVFSSLHIDLPLPTRILLGISAFISSNGTLSVALVIGFFVLLAILKRIPVVRPILHRMILTIPIIGKIAKRVNLARFTRPLGTMIHSGMAIDEAIPITKTVLRNDIYRKMFDVLKVEVTQGNTMTSVFEKYPTLVPPMATHMIYVGEQAGSLDAMLLYLADFYETEVDEITANLSTILEPILLIFIGLMVGGLALAVIMPIYQVIGSF